MKRFLRVEFLDGSIWDIPLHYIATEVAKMLTDEETGTDKFQGGEVYRQVYKRVWEDLFQDENRLVEYAQSKTGWEDYKKFAKCAKEKTIDLPAEVEHAVEWPKAKMEVIIMA